MKELLISFILLFVVCGYASSVAKDSSIQQSVESKRDTSKVGGTLKIKKDETKRDELVVEGVKAVAYLGAGAFIAKKLHCERFDIEVEYLMLDACLNTCLGVEDKASRIKKCARAIQDMECSEGLSDKEIKKRVNSCSLH